MKKFKEEIVANSDLEAKELISSVKRRPFASKVDIINYKTDILEWMFIFWIAQIILTFAFIRLFIKK